MNHHRTKKRLWLEVTLGLIVSLAVVACGGGSSDESVPMPALESKRLDVALSDLKAQGIDEDRVEVIGGGAFGVIDETNWTVCSQEPAIGESTEDKIRLVVDRSCEDDDVAENSEPTDDVAKTEQDEKVDTFTMPDLIGMVLQDAQDKLQGEGSYLMQQVDATGMHRPKLLDSNWRVCAQTPNAGETTPIDAVVRLEAVKLDENCP